LISLKSINAIEDKIPEKNLFWTALFLRAVIPADIMSYILGLFTRIKFWPFVVVSLIGMAPAAFLLAYVGTVHPLFQVIAFLIVGIIFLVVLIVWELRKRRY